MRKKLMSTYILIIAVTVIVTVIFSWNSVNEQLYEQVREETELQIRLIEKIFKYEYETEKENFDFQEFVLKYSADTELRITIINEEGLVVADNKSDPATMENHRNREEFRAALRGNEGTSLRYSNTIQVYSFYYAIPLVNDGFSGALRVSIAAGIIEDLIWELFKSVLLGMLIGVILSATIAYLFSRRFMKPIDELTQTAKIIAEGDYDNKAYIDNQDQIGELSKAFNTMTFTLRRNIWEIETKNAELEAILTSMDTGLAAIDENYRIILSNEPFRKVLDLEEDLDGKIFYEVTRNPIIFSVIEKSIDDDEYVEEEARLRKQGQEIILKISSTPIRNKEDKKIRHGILLAVENITNLRKLENIRRDFVSNVTHELKTPLTSIKGFVEILKKGDIDDPEISERFLDIIDIESDRLTLLIEDILTLSEIESMRLDKKVGHYQVEELVGEVTDMLSIKAEKKGVGLKVDIQEDMKDLRCNRDRIKQLFINLLDNAIKYTEKGSVTLECYESRDNQFLIIKVMDTGIGIKEEHLERLFERFYRVDKGRSRKLGGTGLGLSIVKHIVELHNGTVDVKSNYGEGTTMKVRIPFNT